eukprot:g902.t1
MVSSSPSTAAAVVKKVRRLVLERAAQRASDPARLVTGILRKCAGSDPHADIAPEALRAMLRDFFRINIPLKLAWELHEFLDQTGDGILTRDEAISAIVDAEVVSPKVKRAMRAAQQEAEDRAFAQVWEEPVVVDGFSDKLHKRDDQKTNHAAQRAGFEATEFRGSALEILRVARQKILSHARNDKDVVRLMTNMLRRHDGMLDEQVSTAEGMQQLFGICFDIKLNKQKAHQIFKMLDIKHKGSLSREEIVRGLAGVADRDVSDDVSSRLHDHEEQKRRALLAPTHVPPKFEGSAHAFLSLLREKIMARAAGDADVVRRMTNLLRKHDGVRSDVLLVKDMQNAFRIVFDVDLPDNKAQQVFDMLDTTNAGQITRDEIVRGVTGLGARRPLSMAVGRAGLNNRPDMNVQVLNAPAAEKKTKKKAATMNSRLRGGIGGFFGLGGGGGNVHVEGRRRLSSVDGVAGAVGVEKSEEQEWEQEEQARRLLQAPVVAPGRRRLLYLLRQERVGAVAMAEKQAAEALAVVKAKKEAGSRANAKRRRSMRRRRRRSRSGRLRLTTTARVAADTKAVGLSGHASSRLRSSADGSPVDIKKVLSSASGALGKSAKRLSEWSKDHTAPQLQMVESERAGYERWWLLLRSQLPDSLGGERWSALVLGRNLGLLSVKLASGYPNATIVSLKRAGDYTEAHLSLLSLFKLRNNLLCDGELGAEVLQRAHQTREAVAKAKSGSAVKGKSGGDRRFRYQVLGMDTLELVFEATMGSAESKFTGCDIGRFEQLLGLLLSMAWSTVFEVPPASLLFRAAELFNGNCPPNWLEDRYGTTSTSQAQADQGSSSGNGGGGNVDTVQVFSRLFSAAVQRVGLKGVSLVQVQPPVQPPSAASASPFGVTNTSALYIRLDLAPWARARTSAGAPVGLLNGPGVDLHTLLNLGVLPTLKAELLRLFVELPVARIAREYALGAAELAPWDVRYSSGGDSSGGELAYEGPDGRVFPAFGRPDSGSAGGDDGTAGRLRTIVAQIEARAKKDVRAATKDGGDRWGGNYGQAKQELMEFSLMEYNSGGGALSMALAERFPNATVISIEGKDDLVKSHLQALERHAAAGGGSSGGELRNNIVCHTSVDSDVITKLYESPEFMRFQILSGNLIDRLLKAQGKEGHLENFGKLLGQLLSCGMTTFVQMPSAQVLSLGLNTFFGPLLVPGTAGAAAVGAYRVSAHPLSVFEHSEARLLASLMRVHEEGHTRITANPIGGGADGSAQMLRVDIVKMTRGVNHHFDYARDGHQRKYTMHVIQNNSVLGANYEGGAAPWVKEGQELAIDASKSHGEKEKLEKAKKAEEKKGAEQAGKSKFVVPFNPWSGADGLPLGFHHNNGNAVAVYLTRGHKLSGGSKNRYIPYVVIRAITLISILRLGLVPR